ncbi:MAG: tetratricopeptide repeat protein [Myxococcales bacterium]|nr:tetratricopeptide repeat protein [Myxococcales bacterium]
MAESVSWLEEMKRRRVFRTLLGYGIVAFAILQVIEPVMHGLALPEWVLSVTVVGLGLGFPVALVLAWAFDVKGGRIEKAGAPRGRFLAGLVVAGVVLGAPGVGWYFWRTHRAPVVAEKAPSIAVLPFSDLSAAKDQDWMCDGIAEEILDALCTVSGLRVAARSSSFQFKGKTADVREMARALGVSTLLEGSVRKVGEHLRVSARLVSADGYELWSDKFDGGVSDAFSIQDGIARAVVSALQLRMNRQSPAGTQNAQAYEMYLRGRQYFRALGLENGELARQMFKRAIALDPKFAEAHAGLADVGANLVQWQLLPSAEAAAMRAESLAETEEALRLDGSLAEAHVARGNVLAALGRVDEADQSFRRAIELGPGSRDARYYYARFLFAQKRYADSARMYEEAARINPDDYDSLTLLSMPYARIGQPDKADDARRRSLEASERVLRNTPDDVRALYMSGSNLVQSGEKEKGKARLDQAVALRPADYAVLYNAACGYTFAGEYDRALDFLERAVGTGKGYRAWLESDPDLDPLRKLPRFQQILARLPR